MYINVIEICIYDPASLDAVQYLNSCIVHYLIALTVLVQYLK